MTWHRLPLEASAWPLTHTWLTHTWKSAGMQRLMLENDVFICVAAADYAAAGYVVVAAAGIQ